MSNPLHPRFAEPRLVEALPDTPVVLIHGPRQCGKTTLAQIVGNKRGYVYLSFDDDVTLAAASADPVGFVADLPERAILDEVQRGPGIFTALKTSVDRHRTPGGDRAVCCPGTLPTRRPSRQRSQRSWWVC